MPRQPTFARELIAGFALIFTGAVIVAVVGVVILLPYLDTPLQIVLYLGVLIGADVAVLMLFAHSFLRRRLLIPLERMIADAEAIGGGEYSHRLPEGETVEMDRLSDAVNRMAQRLIKHREQLVANVRSLEETNRQLTEARDELIRAEKMSSVGRLAAGIAHEIGNPLGAIMGYFGILARSANEKEKELISAAEGEASRIDRIVRGLLDYARPREANDPERSDVNDVVDRTVDLLQTQGRLRYIDVEVDLDPALPAVLIEPYQLQQVLVNLMLNAADAMDDVDAASLTLRTGAAEYEATVTIPPRRRDDPHDVDYSHRRRFHKLPRVPRNDPFPAGEPVVELSVADNGPGIREDLLDQIFEPFVTTKEPGKGTGLGLAVAARLIDGMGGTIRAASHPGGGAVFTILLPAADQPAEPDRTRGAVRGSEEDAAPASIENPRRASES